MSPQNRADQDDDHGHDRRRGPSVYDLELRLTILEQQLKTLEIKVDEINKNMSWLVRIVLAAVIAGLMGILLKGGGPI